MTSLKPRKYRPPLYIPPIPPSLCPAEITTICFTTAHHGFGHAHFPRSHLPRISLGSSHPDCQTPPRPSLHLLRPPFCYFRGPRFFWTAPALRAWWESR